MPASHSVRAIRTKTKLCLHALAREPVEQRHGGRGLRRRAGGACRGSSALPTVNQTGAFQHGAFHGAHRTPSTFDLQPSTASGTFGLPGRLNGYHGPTSEGGKHATSPLPRVAPGPGGVRRPVWLRLQLPGREGRRPEGTRGSSASTPRRRRYSAPRATCPTTWGSASSRSAWTSRSTGPTRRCASR